MTSNPYQMTSNPYQMTSNPHQQTPSLLTAAVALTADAATPDSDRWPTQSTRQSPPDSAVTVALTPGIAARLGRPHSSSPEPPPPPQTPLLPTD